MITGKRAEARADREANVILSSLAAASRAAIETTLNKIVDELKKNTPLMYHIHALLQNEEWRGVLEASISGQAARSSGEKPGQDDDVVDNERWRLRQNMKKFLHLLRQRFKLYRA